MISRRIYNKFYQQFSQNFMNSSSPIFSSANRSTNWKIVDLVSQNQPLKDITIQGWVNRCQKHGKMLFLKINDGTSPHKIQVVVPRTLCSTVSVGSAIILHGEWVVSFGQGQNMEFLADKCLFMGKTEEHNLSGDNDVLRQIPHLRPKRLEFSALLRMRSNLTHLTHQFFKERSFIHVDTPLLSQNDCEGAGEAFSVNCPNEFFSDSKAFLPVSAQLHLEALSGAITNVYTISPAFRANPSCSRQHLAEFRMLEMECAFFDSLNKLCIFVEEFLRFIVLQTSMNLGEEFKASKTLCGRSPVEGNFNSQILSKYFSNRLNKPIPRITFLEALSILHRLPEDQKSLNKQDELELVNVFQGPVFITHFPSRLKPFYMRRVEGSELTESFDLLAPFVGELAGGSVREWDSELLANRLSALMGENAHKLDWYLELRRQGYPRSSGFGIGMDRLMQTLFGIVNIKDTIPFPRWPRQAIKC